VAGSGGKKKFGVKGRRHGGGWADGVVADPAPKAAKDEGGGGEHIVDLVRRVTFQSRSLLLMGPEENA
jgi:hypothetical protein